MALNQSNLSEMSSAKVCYFISFHLYNLFQCTSINTHSTNTKFKQNCTQSENEQDCGKNKRADVTCPEYKTVSMSALFKDFFAHLSLKRQNHTKSTAISHIRYAHFILLYTLDI